MSKKLDNTNKTKQGAECLVICTIPEEYEIFDIRAKKPVHYKNDTDSIVVQEIDQVEFSVKSTGVHQLLDYYKPNNVGILLNVSEKSQAYAKELFTYICTIEKLSDNYMQEILHNSKYIYDFIEHLQMCIVFGYTALEAFTNLSIPEYYLYTNNKNSKGITETYDKEAIERWLPLNTKIAEIVVSIYKTKQIKGLKIWSQFIEFEKLRNEIIHQKSIEATNFYKKYFNHNIFELCNIPKKIIKFFFDEREDKAHTDPLWPWMINEKNEFPSRYYDLNETFVIGSGKINEYR